MRRALAVIAGVLIAVSGGPLAASGRQAPFPQGLYGNVDYAEGSGDLGGFEARFFVDPATGRQMVEFTYCEGWCSVAYTAEVVRADDGFAFAHVETLATRDGDRVIASEDHRVEYRVTRAGRALRVRYFQDGREMNPGAPWRIRPIRRAFGLAVARQEQAEGRRP